MREPFGGWKLSSGHVIFHMAYLFGSFVARRLPNMNDTTINQPESKQILFQLNLAHILVPLFTFLRSMTEERKCWVLSRIMLTFSILQYQATIFYAQYYQMNSKDYKLSGLNLWFLIEILSFYGYIISAVLFIA